MCFVTWCNVLWLVVDSFTSLSFSLPPSPFVHALISLISQENICFYCDWLDVVICHMRMWEVESHDELSSSVSIFEGFEIWMTITWIDFRFWGQDANAWKCFIGGRWIFLLFRWRKIKKKKKNRKLKMKKSQISKKITKEASKYIYGAHGEVEKM